MGAILKDLSKAYDCLPHDLLIEKCEAYDIDKNKLSLIHNYLLNRKQRTKISSSYSDWYNIVIRPMIFRLITQYIAVILIGNLEHDIQNALKLIKVISVKSNQKKLQFMILGKSTRESIILNINNIKIKESSSLVLLGLTVDNRLTFKDHINLLCRRASF